jgi:hypothetical protein
MRKLKKIVVQIFFTTVTNNFHFQRVVKGNNEQGRCRQAEESEMAFTGTR